MIAASILLGRTTREHGFNVLSIVGRPHMLQISITDCSGKKSRDINITFSAVYFSETPALGVRIALRLVCSVTIL